MIFLFPKLVLKLTLYVIYRSSPIGGKVKLFRSFARFSRILNTNKNIDYSVPASAGDPETWHT